VEVGARLRAAALAVLAAAGACGDDDERVPAACPADRQAVLSGLRSAPGAVRVDGVRLSECLAKGSDAEDVQRVGAAYVGAAGVLAPRARRRPEGEAALRLGYLVGATRRGASGTQGIHSELVRRMEQEITVVNARSHAFGRGERAGRTLG
jgi:hypothetical protein